MRNGEVMLLSVLEMSGHHHSELLLQRASQGWSWGKSWHIFIAESQGNSFPGSIYFEVYPDCDTRILNIMMISNSTREYDHRHSRCISIAIPHSPFPNPHPPKPYPPSQISLWELPFPTSFAHSGGLPPTSPQTNVFSTSLNKLQKSLT